MPITSPQEKFVYSSSMLYGAENQFLQLNQHSDEELKGLLRTQVDESVQRVQNLEQAFS